MESINEAGLALQRLDLSGLHEGSDDVVSTLCGGPARISLQTLQLDRWENLSDKALTTIGNHCKNLRTLDLSHSTDLTEAGVIRMIGKLEGIETIGLGRGEHITPRGKLLVMQMLRARSERQWLETRSSHHVS